MPFLHAHSHLVFLQTQNKKFQVNLIFNYVKRAFISTLIDMLMFSLHTYIYVYIPRTHAHTHTHTHSLIYIYIHFSNGVQLLSLAREIRTPLSQDTTGVKVGPAILHRAIKELREVMGSEASTYTTVKIDPFDCHSQW